MSLTHAQITERPCCACGCGRPVNLAKHDDRANGYVRGRPFTYLRGHAPRSAEPQYRVTEGGCWEWQRCLGPDGYGQLQRLGVRYLAHRYFYEQKVGPIPEGLQLDHLCRNRACVNPEHLEPVTNAENGRRGRGTKLTPAAVQAIREATDDSRVVAARHGISRSYVYTIRRGDVWSGA
jgi:hypothetical protein